MQITQRTFWITVFCVSFFSTTALAQTTPSFDFRIGADFTAPGILRSPSAIVGDASGNIYVADRDNHRIQKFNSTGSFLLEFGQLGDTAGAFNQPASLALAANGDIFVCDTENNRIQKFDATGGFLLEFNGSASGTALLKPGGVAVDSAGTVYVADSGNDRILKFDLSGTYQATIGAPGSNDGEFDQPVAISLDGSNNLYVADKGNERIQVFNASGTFIRNIDGHTSSPSFCLPTGCAVDGDGNVYVCDSLTGQILKINPAGSVVQTYAGTVAENSWLQSPGQCFVDTSGNLCVANTNRHNIVIYAPNGSLVLRLGDDFSAAGSLDRPAGVSIDNFGNIYICEFGNHRIQKFDPNGNLLDTIGSFGSGPGQFNGPTKVVFDAANTCYVVDSGNNRIQIFDSTGAYVGAFGGTGSGPGQFNSPLGIACGGGTIYVADCGNARVQIFGLDGTYQSSFGTRGSGPGEFSFPQGVTIAPDGTIYVTDGGNNCIYQFSASGSYIRSIGSPGSGPGQFNNPYEISFDSYGQVYVVDFGNNRVQKCDANFNFITSFGGTPGIANPQPGSFTLPIGCVIDGDKVYVCSYGSNDLQAFTSRELLVYGQVPAEGAEINTSQPTFQWSPVANSTGVSYQFQLSSSSDFNPLSVDQANLGNTFYTVPNPLPDGVCYWRVRATDEATGESGPWSPTASCVIVTEGLDFAINAEFTPAINCFFPNTAAIDVTPIGGQTPYSFSWHTGQATEDLVDVSAGVYILTATDGAGTEVRKVYSIGYQVHWTDLVGLNPSGESLQKTASDGWDNGGAASTNRGFNGWASFFVEDPDATWAIGISRSNTDEDRESIEFAFVLENRQLSIYENGVPLPGLVYEVAVGDELKINFTGSSVGYYHNSEKKRSTSLPVNFQSWIVEASIYDQNGFLPKVSTLFCGNPVE